MAWSDGVEPESVAYRIASAVESRIRVLAGPGTGKSFAMKRRVARLLEEGASPSSILAVTFTRVAAEDLHRELTQLKVPGCESLEGRTLHSLAMRMLARKHILDALGRHARPLNRFEQKALIADLAEQSGGKRTAGKLIRAYEAAWAQSQGDEPGFTKNAHEAAFSQRLVSWLKFHEVMLIGELIPYLLKYLFENPSAPERTEYKHVLVDEFQDLNKAEQAVVSLLCESGHACVVGDDDQSIYSFKHANPEGIRNWVKDNPTASDHEMADCHRCPTTVVEMANELISKNTDRDARTLKALPANGAGDVRIVQLMTLDAEASWIALEVRKLLDAGVMPGEVIVLVQRSITGNPIVQALRAAGVPAKSYYEENQLDTDAAQERFAQLKLVLNREDRAALRYLLGLGHADFHSKAYSRLRKFCETSGKSPWVAMTELAKGAISLPHTAPLVKNFHALEQRLLKLEGAQADLESFVAEWLPPGEEAISELRLLALEALKSSTTTGELMQFISDEITQPDVPPAIDQVRVMSLHKSKGLSSPFVFIASCVEGVLPQKPKDDATPEEQAAALQEARRLFYVGITRVKADLKNGRVGSLVITSARRIESASAHKGRIKVIGYEQGQAVMLASQFLSELGSSAPKPVSG